MKLLQKAKNIYLIAPILALAGFVVPLFVSTAPVHADNSPVVIVCKDKQQVTANSQDTVSDYNTKCANDGGFDHVATKSELGSCPAPQTGTPPNCVTPAPTNCGSVKTSGVIPLTGNCKAGDSTNPIFNMLVYFIQFLSIGVGLAVAGGIIWGGILFTTARGNASQTQKGVTTIVNSVVGLVLYIFMFAILNFLIPGGVFK